MKASVYNGARTPSGGFTGRQGFKILSILALFLGLSGAFACIGGGGSGGTNLAGSGASAPPGAAPNGGNPPGGGPLTNAAAPGQQPTELGWGNEVPGRIFVYVAKPDGTVELSLTEETGGTCSTSAGPTSPLLFPNDKPSIYGTFPWGMPPGPCVTNACGQGAATCPKNESTDLYAILNDQGLIYQSDTVRIDCNNLPSTPVILTLRSTHTSDQVLPPSEAPSSEGASVPLQ